MGENRSLQNTPLLTIEAHSLVQWWSTFPDGAPKLESPSRICKRGTMLNAQITLQKPLCILSSHDSPTTSQKYLKGSLLQPRCFWCCYKLIDDVRWMISLDVVPQQGFNLSRRSFFTRLKVRFIVQESRTQQRVEGRLLYQNPLSVNSEN